MRDQQSSYFKGALDRALCLVEWIKLFSKSKIVHLVTSCSDHAPILLKVGEKQGGGTKRFRFQAPWVSHALTY